MVKGNNSLRIDFILSWFVVPVISYCSKPKTLTNAQNVIAIMILHIRCAKY